MSGVSRFTGFADMTKTTGVCDFCGNTGRTVYVFQSHTPATHEKTISLCLPCVEDDIRWEVDRADERAEDSGDD